jgi:hypothetical protein
MTQYQAGETYRVPAMLFGGAPVDTANGDTLSLTEYQGFTGWLPLLIAPKRDESFLSALEDHAHVDYRFLPDEWLRHFEAKHGCRGVELFTHVVLFGAHVMERKLIQYLPIQHRRMKCYRTFDAIDYSIAHYMPRLEEKYACAALRNGKCPHRGTSRAAMIERDGELVCPAHGLKWTKAGRLSPWLP